jgi:phosphoglycolate phosphatase
MMQHATLPISPQSVEPDVGFLHPISGRPIKAVLFDLDGTLVDSAPDIASAVNIVMAQDGIAPHSVATVRTLIGEGIHRLVEKAYALQHRSLSFEDLNARTAIFAALYEANIAVETRPYPSVLEGLESLKQRGIKTAVVSNKAHHLTQHLLRELQITGHVDLILGAQDKLPKKPAPDMLLFAMAELNVSADETIFVGDSIADVRAAAAAVLPCLLIDGGYTVEPAAQLGAWKTVSDFDAFLRLFVTATPT